MPIFEYACRRCGGEFEALVLASQAPACPSCGGAELDRLLSSFAVSSDGTRQLALKSARARDKKAAGEKARVQSEYERGHND